MGLSRSSIAWLMEEARRRPFSGRLLTLGVQNVAITEAEIEALAREQGVALRPISGPRRPPLQDGSASADTVFRRLGFDEVVETDVSDFEGAGLILDLNDPRIPGDHLGRYDVVLDSGTLEHVFHLPNALKGVLDLTAVGGRIVHMSPSSNHMDHGFYMFSPTFYWDFYTANGLEIARFDVYRYTLHGAARDPWTYGRYAPGSLDGVSIGGLGGGAFGVAVAVEKTRAVDALAVPQQGMYQRMWQQSSAPPGPARRVSGFRRARRALRARLATMLPPWLRIWYRSARARFPISPSRRL